MDNNNQGEGKFFNGFLLGLLVGAFAVFLLGTKKGKRIWKAISEEGLDNISNILEEVDKTEDLDEAVKKPTFFAQPSPRLRPASKTSEEQEGNLAHREFAIRQESLEKPKVRRFFRGISRRVN